jgi:DNA repair protein RecO (recombination protein O)
MRVTTHGIVLHNVKYADTKVISKIYTKDFGLLSLNIHVSNTGKSSIKPALIQPLSQLELVFSLKENKDIHQLTDARPTYIYNGLSQHFIKLCIAQFINEVLHKCLKEQSKNEELYEFIIHIFQWLDVNDEGFYDLHIYVLFELTKYLGFYPNNNYSQHEKYFDTREGRYHAYSQSFPLSLDEEQSRLFAQLFSYNLNSPKQFSRSERLNILDCLMAYYKMHIPGLHEFRSYAVLQETMNG